MYNDKKQTFSIFVSKEGISEWGKLKIAIVKME